MPGRSRVWLWLCGSCCNINCLPWRFWLQPAKFHADVTESRLLADPLLPIWDVSATRCQRCSPPFAPNLLREVIQHFRFDQNFTKGVRQPQRRISSQNRSHKTPRTLPSRLYHPILYFIIDQEDSFMSYQTAVHQHAGCFDDSWRPHTTECAQDLYKTLKRTRSKGAATVLPHQLKGRWQPVEPIRDEAESPAEQRRGALATTVVYHPRQETSVPRQ